MRFVIGRPPDDSTFAPEQGGWQRLREMGPLTLMLFGSLAGIPLAAFVSYAWSRIPGSELSIGFDITPFGRWAMALLPLIVISAMAVFLACLIFIHELVHVLACPRFGFTSDTVLGVWPSRILAYGHHSGPVSLGRFLMVGMAPFLVLSLAPLLFAVLGGPHWPIMSLISIVNALVCGGDALICLMLVSQVPFNATLRNKGWDTWWRPAGSGAEPEHRT